MTRRLAAEARPLGDGGVRLEGRDVRSFRQLVDWLDAQDPQALAKMRTLGVGEAPKQGWASFLSGRPAPAPKGLPGAPLPRILSPGSSARRRCPTSTDSASPAYCRNSAPPKDRF